MVLNHLEEINHSAFVNEELDLAIKKSFMYSVLHWDRKSLDDVFTRILDFFFIGWVLIYIDTPIFRHW